MMTNFDRSLGLGASDSAPAIRKQSRPDRRTSQNQLCLCGCGENANKSGYYTGHWNRTDFHRVRTSKLHRRNSRTNHGDGYICVKPFLKPSKLEHILIAERVLGRSLPSGAEIHHVNHIRSDNRNTNLVICPSHAYHRLLHQREKALDACGHAHWRKCFICKKYDDPNNLFIPKKRGSIVHRECQNQRRRDKQNVIQQRTN